MAIPISNNHSINSNFGDMPSPAPLGVGGLVMAMNLINSLPTSPVVKNLGYVGDPAGPLAPFFQSMQAGLAQNNISVSAGSLFSDGLADLNNGNIAGAQSLFLKATSSLPSPPPLTSSDFNTIINAIGNLATAGDWNLIQGQFISNMVIDLGTPMNLPQSATRPQLLALKNILDTLEQTINMVGPDASTVEGYVAMASNMWSEMCG